MSEVDSNPDHWAAYQLLQRLVVEEGGYFAWSSGRLTIDIAQVPITPEEKALLDSLDGPTPTYPVTGTPTPTPKEES